MAYALDQDGVLVEEHERHRRRGLRITRRTDGSARLEGDLTALCAEALLSTLQPLAAPAPAQDGAKDPRTCGQRLHDALHDAALIALRSQQLPDCAGFAATIVLHMSPDHFDTGTGLVTTGHGAQISVPEALTLFGDARIFPVLLGDAGQIIAHGHSRRIFTEGQRLAMTARDLGCSFPGCTHPPTRCQAHHITDYTITRKTSVDDGTLVCGFHHLGSKGSSHRLEQIEVGYGWSYSWVSAFCAARVLDSDPAGGSAGSGRGRGWRVRHVRVVLVSTGWRHDPFGPQGTVRSLSVSG
jgi:hypothetical protein